VHWVAGAGNGSVYSFSVLHREPFPDYPVPFVLAIVELDEGYNMFSLALSTANTRTSSATCGSK
jgi:hypothetical protein